MEGKDSPLKVKILPNGPYLVQGPMEIVMSDGTTVSRESASLCRCGASNNKPYCDGSHTKAGFKG